MLLGRIRRDLCKGCYSDKKSGESIGIVETYYITRLIKMAYTL